MLSVPQILGGLCVTALAVLLFSCSDSTNDPIVNPDDRSKLITVSPSQTHQTMIGFGGSLSWYCDRITSSSKRDEIIDIMVNDLGIDMVRLKNWYYPDNYPDNKNPNDMEVGWFVNHFNATNLLYDLFKQANPEIGILLSSWGPPSSLKSNNQLERGTLRKESDGYMYDAYANYWEDVMQHIAFVPDYLSIQNEPTWVADWTTCEWRPSETSTFPGYDIAFEKVTEKLNAAGYHPHMLAPDAANVSTGAFDAFLNQLRDNPELDAYGYHLYNFNQGSSLSSIQSRMSEIGSGYSDRPLIMTEYSGMTWMKTAQLINSTLREGNTAAYLYWTLMWAEDSSDAMIKVYSNGDYELTPFYYLLRHYGRYVDAGDHRIELESEAPGLDQVAFMDPQQTEIVIITVNPGADVIEIKFEVEGKEVSSMTSWWSTEDDPFKQITTNPGSLLVVNGMSVTTTVLELE